MEVRVRERGALVGFGCNRFAWRGIERYNSTICDRIIILATSFCIFLVQILLPHSIVGEEKKSASGRVEVSTLLLACYDYRGE